MIILDRTPGVLLNFKYNLFLFPVLGNALLLQFVYAARLALSQKFF